MQCRRGQFAEDQIVPPEIGQKEQPQGALPLFPGQRIRGKQGTREPGQNPKDRAQAIKQPFTDDLWRCPAGRQDQQQNQNSETYGTKSLPPDEARP